MNRTVRLVVGWTVCIVLIMAALVGALAAAIGKSSWFGGAWAFQVVLLTMSLGAGVLGLWLKDRIAGAPPR